MAGTMSQEDLVDDLKDSLFDTAAIFQSDDNAEFKRFLDQALPDMGVKRPITRLGSLQLAADQERFLVQEADFAQLKVDLWRDATKLPKPWEPNHPGPLPRISAQRDADGWWIAFDPAPTVYHLSALGTTFKHYYFALHAIGEDAADTTVNPQDRPLLLLRGQVEAMMALALRNAGKPVQLRDGLSGVARNSTPAALAEALLQRFWECR
jgi:hypothetical protein